MRKQQLIRCAQRVLRRSESRTDHTVLGLHRHAVADAADSRSDLQRRHFEAWAQRDLLSSPAEGFRAQHRVQSHRQASTSAAASSDAEIEKFNRLAQEWWNPQGPFSVLLSMTPVRTAFVRGAVSQILSLQEHTTQPFEGLAVLDVGCGGGLLAESLARLGATVTGIDLSKDSIGAANAHAQADPRVRELVEYRACSAEDLLEQGVQYHAVIASEVIEHVSNPAGFLQTLAQLLRNDGALVVSTISRTARSYAFAIVGAEVVSGIIPRGTHDWNKFLTPEDLMLLAEGTQLSLRQIAGMSLNLLSQQWSLSQDLAVNYIACFQKQALTSSTPPHREADLHISVPPGFDAQFHVTQEGR